MTLSGFVAYIKQLWANKPSTSSPLSAERLNHMEEGIKANSDGITKVVTSVTDQVVNDTNKIASAASLYSVKQVVDKTNSDLAALETTLSERGTILGYLAQVPDTDTVQKTYDLTPYSGVYVVLNFNGFTNSDYIPLTGLVTGTRVISVRPEEAYYCNAKYTFVKPVGSYQGTFKFVGTTKHNASVAATLTIYGVK